MGTKNPTIGIIDGRLWKNVATIIITYLAFVSMIGLGWLLDSSAMEWAGFVLFLMSVFGRSLGSIEKLTISQAHQYLDELEGSK